LAQKNNYPYIDSGSVSVVSFGHISPSLTKFLNSLFELKTTYIFHYVFLGAFSWLRIALLLAALASFANVVSFEGPRLASNHRLLPHLTILNWRNRPAAQSRTNPDNPIPG
jgi:hypothetical protein